VSITVGNRRLTASAMALRPHQTTRHHSRSDVQLIELEAKDRGLGKVLTSITSSMRKGEWSYMEVSGQFHAPASITGNHQTGGGWAPEAKQKTKTAVWGLFRVSTPNIGTYALREGWQLMEENTL
jgi:hypothetical protein